MNHKLEAYLAPLFADIAHAKTGELGDPKGNLAYAYIRVSTSGQAEEGSTGLPRQLLHIHECALKFNFRIPFSLLYADDHTGFEFKERPDLQCLLADISRPDRVAHALIIENLDRLSRNAKWHQGYLLDVFEQQKVSTYFWKAFHSDIERAVLGAISEQGMRHEIERMKQGMRMKAKSGRITARRPAYGFLFADSQGRSSNDPTSNYRKDTHYAHDPDSAPIMKEMFHRIVGGDSLYTICNDFEQRKILTPKNAKHWATGNVSRMLKNPVYKGIYACNRWYRHMEWSERLQRMTKRLRERPEEEWVTIPVPPIVSPKIWEEAQKALKRNYRKSTRNTRMECLIQNYVVCAKCDHNFKVGGTTGPIVDGKRTRPFYICGSYHTVKHIRERLYCHSPILYSDIIDSHVWQSICSLITEPDILISYIEEESAKFQRGELNDQLTYLERQLKKCDQEAKKWDDAYTADIFTLDEYREKKQAVNERKEALLDEYEKLMEEMEVVAMYENKRELIYEHLAMIKDAGFALELPFKDKRKIMAMLIDQVVVDSKNGWYRLEGVIEGSYQYDNRPSGQGGGGGESSSDFGYSSAP